MVGFCVKDDNLAQKMIFFVFFSIVFKEFHFMILLVPRNMPDFAKNCLSMCFALKSIGIPVLE